jgi:hypothetical protein
VRAAAFLVRRPRHHRSAIYGSKIVDDPRECVILQFPVELKMLPTVLGRTLLSAGFN